MDHIAGGNKGGGGINNSSTHHSHTDIPPPVLIFPLCGCSRFVSIPDAKRRCHSSKHVLHFYWEEKERINAKTAETLTHVCLIKSQGGRWTMDSGHVGAASPLSFSFFFFLLPNVR